MYFEMNSLLSLPTLGGVGSSHALEIAQQQLRKVNEIPVRVTIDQNGTRATLKLEGRIAGLFVPECAKAWQSLSPKLQAKKLCLDLRGVTFVDRTGMDLLTEIYQKTGAKFLTSSPLTQYFAEQAMRNATSRESSSPGNDNNRMLKECKKGNYEFPIRFSNR